MFWFSETIELNYYWTFWDFLSVLVIKKSLKDFAWALFGKYHWFFFEMSETETLIWLMSSVSTPNKWWDEAKNEITSWLWMKDATSVGSAMLRTWLSQFSPRLRRAPCSGTGTWAWTPRPRETFCGPTLSRTRSTPPRKGPFPGEGCSEIQRETSRGSTWPSCQRSNATRLATVTGACKLS